MLGLLGFAVVAALLAAVSSAVAIRILCGLGAAFFLALFLIGLPNLFRRGDAPLLTVSDQGVETPRIGLVPWAAIDEVGQTRVVGQPALGIWTKDPFYAARHGPWYFWPFALVNRCLREPALSFTEKAVPVDVLLVEIERHWRTSQDITVLQSPSPLPSSER